MLRDAVDFTSLSRVLVIKLRHHGDVLLTSPVFSVLKTHYPHLELDALVYRDTQDMLSLHPAISNLHTVARSRGKQSVQEYLRGELELANRLRERRYDALIHLTEHNRGLWLSWLLRPRIRVAYSNRRSLKKLWKKSYTHLVAPGNPRRHTVEHHLDALRRMGLQPAKSERALVLVPGQTAEHAVAKHLAALGLDNTPFIHIHPTSRWLFKCWETRKFAELIDALHDGGSAVVVTAAPDSTEMAFVDEILRNVRQAPFSLAGKLSLKELAALTSRARCFVGVDSAPMHIAAAMKTPVVALFGPSGDLEWGPWQTPNVVITTGHACRPCGQDGCGGGKVSECLQDIEVAQVHAAVNRMLTR